MWKLRTHLKGAIAHDIGNFGYFDYYQCPHSSNLTIHVLLSILSQLKHLPDTLYLQLDNCAGGYKNRQVSIKTILFSLLLLDFLFLRIS